MKTNKDIVYRDTLYGVIATIPKGTEVFEAFHIPEEGYWCKSWIGMNDIAKSWHRNYGFFINPENVEF